MSFMCGLGMCGRTPDISFSKAEDPPSHYSRYCQSLSLDFPGYPPMRFFAWPQLAPPFFSSLSLSSSPFPPPPRCAVICHRSPPPLLSFPDFPTRPKLFFSRCDRPFFSTSLPSSSSSNSNKYNNRRLSPFLSFFHIRSTTDVPQIAPSSKTIDDEDEGHLPRHRDHHHYLHHGQAPSQVSPRSLLHVTPAAPHRTAPPPWPPLHSSSPTSSLLGLSSPPHALPTSLHRRDLVLARASCCDRRQTTTTTTFSNQLAVRGDESSRTRTHLPHHELIPRARVALAPRRRRRRPCPAAHPP